MGKLKEVTKTIFQTIVVLPPRQVVTRIGQAQLDGMTFTMDDLSKLHTLVEKGEAELKFSDGLAVDLLHLGLIQKVPKPVYYLYRPGPELEDWLWTNLNALQGACMQSARLRT